MLNFTIPGAELGAGCFCFHETTPIQRAGGSESKRTNAFCVPKPRRENGSLLRAMASMKGYIPHWYKHWMCC